MCDRRQEPSWPRPSGEGRARSLVAGEGPGNLLDAPQLPVGPFADLFHPPAGTFRASPSKSQGVAVQTRQHLVVIAVSTALALSACGGSSPTTAVSSAPAVPTVAQSDTPAPTPSDPVEGAPQDAALVEAFLSAINTFSDPEVMREALPLTEDGSPANVYVTHLANTAEAALDGGTPLTDTTHEKLDDSSFKSCDDPSLEETCVTFGDFKVNASGQLVDLTVDSKAIGDRLTAGNGEVVSAGGAKFTFLTANRSIQSNALFVSVKVEAGNKAINPFAASATYRSPDGKQRQATQAYGPTDIDAKSNSIVTMIFQGVKAGGKVTLEGCVDECASDFKVVIKVG